MDAYLNIINKYPTAYKPVKWWQDGKIKYTHNKVASRIVTGAAEHPKKSIILII